MAFANLNKNSTSYTNTDKNATTFSFFLRHGKDPQLAEIADFTFNDVVFSDGSVLKDVTFEQLGNVVWSLVNKS